MPPELSWRRMQRDMVANPPVNIVLAARRNVAEPEELQRLNITAALQQDFRGILDGIAGDNFRLIEYTPGYKPDSNEILWVDLHALPDISAIVGRIANLQALVLFDEDEGFVDALAYYALLARLNNNRGLVFFRKTSEKLELAHGAAFGAIFRRGQYDRIEETMFLFDRSIDCWSDGRYVFIKNPGNFERIFRYYEQLQRRAEETVVSVLERIPISNVDEFREACTTQVRFMTKLAVIARKPYLGQIGMADIRRAIREHNLDVEIVREDGQEKLLFDPDPSRRWILLKLLDDDYLNSVMTHLKYEVNSKIPQQAANE
jgi:Domain of unknown function (DUF4868)